MAGIILKIYDNRPDMEDSTLKKYFDDFTEKIDELKAEVREIDIWNRSQYRKIIILEERQKQLEKDAEEHKTSMRWRINLIVPAITAILIVVANFFMPKSG